MPFGSLYAFACSPSPLHRLGRSAKRLHKGSHLPRAKQTQYVGFPAAIAAFFMSAYVWTPANIEFRRHPALEIKHAIDGLTDVIVSLFRLDVPSLQHNIAFGVTFFVSSFYNANSFRVDPQSRHKQYAGLVDECLRRASVIVANDRHHPPRNQKALDKFCAKALREGGRAQRTSYVSHEVKWMRAFPVRMYPSSIYRSTDVSQLAYFIDLYRTSSHDPAFLAEQSNVSSRMKSSCYLPDIIRESVRPIKTGESQSYLYYDLKSHPMSTIGEIKMRIPRLSHVIGRDFADVPTIGTIDSYCPTVWRFSNFPDGFDLEAQCLKAPVVDESESESESEFESEDESEDEDQLVTRVIDERRKRKRHETIARLREIMWDQQPTLRQMSKKMKVSENYISDLLPDFAESCNAAAMPQRYRVRCTYSPTTPTYSPRAYSPVSPMPDERPYTPTSPGYEPAYSPTSPCEFIPSPASHSEEMHSVIDAKDEMMRSLQRVSTKAGLRNWLSEHQQMPLLMNGAH
jgi:hypothetical protein